MPKSKSTKTASRKRSKTVSKPRARKAKIVKYTPNRRGKSIARRKAIARKKSGPIGRLWRKPVTKISVGALACGLAAYFIIVNNHVPTLEDIQKSVVKIEACNELEYNCGTGSGFAAFGSNYIVTNYHVIDGADTIKIKTIAGIEREAGKVVAFDPINDIAILEWNYDKLTPIRITSSENAHVGDKVLAIGNPIDETNVVSEGIISSTTSENGLMTTAAISPGSSGGALILDSNHRVIGVTYMKQMSGESMNYAIRIEDVEKVFNAYKRKESFVINDNNIGRCHTSLAQIASDSESIEFKGCADSNTEVYTVDSIGTFYRTTNERVRFERAMNERQDWKAMYDRLGTNVKNNLVAKLKDGWANDMSLYDTNWKNIIWYANETFFYSCQTDYCTYTRYRNSFYPAEYNPANITEDEIAEELKKL